MAHGSLCCELARSHVLLGSVDADWHILVPFVLVPVFFYLV